MPKYEKFFFSIRSFKAWTLEETPVAWPYINGPDDSMSCSRNPINNISKEKCWEGKLMHLLLYTVMFQIVRDIYIMYKLKVILFTRTIYLGTRVAKNLDVHANNTNLLKIKLGVNSILKFCHMRGFLEPKRICGICWFWVAVLFYSIEKLS